MSSRNTQILPNRDSRVLRKSEQTDDLAELVVVSDESVVVCDRSPVAYICAKPGLIGSISATCFFRLAFGIAT